MVIGYHLCFGAYGFWLPNDPRGSGSSAVWAEHLKCFGPATHLEDRSRSVARHEHDRSLRLAAKKALKYPAVQFTGLHAKIIGEGFAEYASRNNVTVWACAILPTHAHLVVARHSYEAESIIEQFKGAATRQLVKAGMHPLAGFTKRNGHRPSCWQRGGWFPFLSTPDEVLWEIGYVADNPAKEGKPRQHWSFVVPYNP